MKQRTLALLTTGILSALLCSAPGFAGDFSAGKEASGEAPRAMGSASEFKGAKAKPVPGIQADRSAYARRPARRRRDREGLYDHRSFERRP